MPDSWSGPANTLEMASPWETRGSVADYFIVAGTGDEITEEKLDEDSPLPNSVDPITDIAVVFLGAGETISPDYNIIGTTPGGLVANFNHSSANVRKGVFVCYRRGRDKPPLIDVE